MNIKKLVYMFKPPCPKCPYTLGYVKCVDNPCFWCKRNNYETYHRLIEISSRAPRGISKD